MADVKNALADLDEELVNKCALIGEIQRKIEALREENHALALEHREQMRQVQKKCMDDVLQLQNEMQGHLQDAKIIEQKKIKLKK